MTNRDRANVAEAADDRAQALIKARCEEFSVLDFQQESGLYDRFKQELPAVLAGSDFVYRLLLRLKADGALPLFCNERLWSPYKKGSHLRQLRRQVDVIESEAELMTVLRRYRNLEIARIVWRETVGVTDLWNSTLNLSELASVSLQLSLEFAEHSLKEIFGEPFDANGVRQSLGILGMGKLGANELNLSSDVDLMFVYGADGETRGGKKQVENQKYFISLGQKVIHIMQGNTADGFVFRVDMRLRPFGNSGPLAQSHQVMISYYQNQGRDWERYALIKASPVAGNISESARLIDALRPFIYRRYIDFSVIESLREMKSLIRREMLKDPQNNNIKVGSGGIREIEFIAQAFQLIRGGQDARLRNQQIKNIYCALIDGAYMPAKVVRQLMEAYLFLRWVEHRLQGFSDIQTHLLPEDQETRQRIVWSLGFYDWDDFLSTLNHHRSNVLEHFNEMVRESSKERREIKDDYVAWWHGQLTEQRLAELLKGKTHDAAKLSAFLSNFRNERKLREMQAIGRERLDQLMPQLLERVSQCDEVDAVIPRVMAVISAIVRRSAYISLLNEQPQALEHLIHFCEASPWIAEQLALHPNLLDELLNGGLTLRPPSVEVLAKELEQQMQLLPLNDDEATMEGLRHFKLAHELRVAAAETCDVMELMKVSDYLTSLAEVILITIQAHAWKQLVEKYGLPSGAELCSRDLPGFIVVAYGKLGGIELSYSSDLDLVFLHPAANQGTTSGPIEIDNALFYMKVAQRMMHMLTAVTVSGPLYEVDLRLRPSGGSGLLVATIDSFEKYQQQRAWTWEHQALVRARVVAGSAEGYDRFNEIRSRILTQQRDKPQLKQDVIEMRDKMRGHLQADRSSDEEFDLKQSPGGIVDIEFMVQYAVLRWAHEFNALAKYTDNVRILEQLAELNIITGTEAEAIKEAYLFYRAETHRLALQKKRTVIPGGRSGNYPERVRAVWEKLLQ